MVCPKCGQALPEDSEFCQYCGSKLAGASVPAGNAAPASAPELAGKTCPFCKAPFMEGEAVVFCSHCEMPHHLECWKENGGCTTFGCTGNIGKIIGAEQKNAQSAPVATRRPAAPAAPKTVPYPTYRSEPQIATPKQEKPAPKQEPRIEKKDVILAENTDRIIQGNIPVLLERSRIQRGAGGEMYAVCSFVPLTDKRIQAMMVDVQCADIWREHVQSVEGFQYLDLRTSRDTPFGETEKIALPDPNTRVIDVVIQKIMFADGTLVQQEGKPDANPNPVPLSQVLNEELLEEFKAETYQNARFVPVNLGQIWVCTCGAINREEEGSCHICGDYLASLTSHLDKDMLQKGVDEKKRIQREKEERERIAREEAERVRREKEERERIAREEAERVRREKEERERKEREERLRIRREKEAAEAAERKRLAEENARKEAEAARIRAEYIKRRNKKTAIVIAIVIVSLLVIYLIGWQLIPAVKYNNAEKAYAAGDLELAYDRFSGISGYKDSRDRAIETRYAQAVYALKSKDFDTAYLYFTEIAGYNDSETMAKEALYQKAEKLLGEESFAEAQAVYEQIKGYKNSNAQIDLCKKAQQYYKAVALFEDGKYKEAAELFESETYKDSKARAQEAYYLYAKQLIDQNKPHDAYLILSQKVNNGTDSYEDSVELAKQVEYRYASDCMAAGNYEEAYASFANVKGYEDSDAQYLEAGYQYALQLFEKKNYEEAAAVFASLDKYKDSVKQANESTYQYALTLRQQKKWLEAEKIFTALGNYSDSAKQVKETKYQHAISLQKEKKWSEAEKLFTELGNYSDSAKQLKETKYQHAVDLVKKKEYKQAVPIFKELGNYEDSLEQWKAAMWSYVVGHKNNDDKTTYEYLTALKRYNYKDSKKYYEDLYTWRATAKFYTSYDSTTAISSVSRYQSQVCVKWTITGGTPGETINVRGYYTTPGGYYYDFSGKYGNTDLRDGSSFSHTLDDFGTIGLAGTLTFKLYNASTGALIATYTLKIT